VTYIVAFGVGTVAAMTAFAAIVSFAAGRTHHHHGAHRVLMATAAVLAIVIGGIWLLPATAAHP
jgi:hypothetical protein